MRKGWHEHGQSRGKAAQDPVPAKSSDARHSGAPSETQRQKKISQAEEERSRSSEKEERMSELSLLFRSLEPPLAHPDNRHTNISKKSDPKDKKSRQPIGRYTAAQCQEVERAIRTGPKDSIQENNEDTKMMGQVLRTTEEGRTVAGVSLGGTKSLSSETQRNHSKAVAAASAALQHRTNRRINADANLQHALLTRSRLQVL